MTETPDTPTERYCVWDETLTQFLGPVTDKKPSAADVKAIAKARPGHSFTVRTV